MHEINEGIYNLDVNAKLFQIQFISYFIHEILHHVHFAHAMMQGWSIVSKHVNQWYNSIRKLVVEKL
jgi:hypothetical protein